MKKPVRLFKPSAPVHGDKSQISGSRDSRPLGSRTERTVRVKSGASQSKTRIADRFSAYLIHHQLTAVESLIRLLQTPVQSLLTWLVVAIALALPATLYVGLRNVQSLGAGWEGAPRLSVYLHKRASDVAIKQIVEQLRSKREVSSVEYISPAQALREFETYSGFGSALQSLDDNPLPAVLLVQPVTAAAPERLELLVKELRANAVVDDANLDMQWVRRLYRLLQLAQRLVAGFGLLLAIGVLLVVGNTIRLAIENRRDEIVIVKLVGGTDAFVRRPFLYTGWWYGIGGGVLASALLALGLVAISDPVARLANLYQSDFRLSGLGLGASLGLILGSGVLGWLGAWLAVGRHLGAIEPK